jgi:uracil-DNA glycosylase family 4
MSRKKLEAEYLSIVKAVEGHLEEAKESGLEELPVEVKNFPPPKKICRTLQDVSEWLGDCRRCKLHSTRTNIVFGIGSAQPDLVFVGEGPGAEEDEQGKPFVGRAGQLLTKMIEAMGLTRDDVYIANVVKCRPPGNRNPEEDEIAACSPFLENQLKVLKPKVICTLGAFATQTLLKTDEKISKLRGRFHPYEGIQLMPTYHPAYLLRNPAEKKATWDDIQMIMKELNLKIP